MNNFNVAIGQYVKGDSFLHKLDPRFKIVSTILLMVAIFLIPSSLTNTYHHTDFSMTIPTSIIKLCSIEKTEKGFIVYSRSNKEYGGEVFTVESLTKSEFNEVRKDQTKYVERITSNNEKTIVMEFPTTTEYDPAYADEYETIGNSINQIKNNIKQHIHPQFNLILFM